MSDVSAMVVIIIVHLESKERVERELARRKVDRFSSVEVEGRGRHRTLHDEFMTAKNLEFQVVTTKAVARELIDWVGTTLSASHSAIAFAFDVLAAPSSVVG